MLLTSIGKFLAFCFQLLPLLYSLYILSGPQITCTLIFVLNFLVTLSLKLFLYFQCLHAALWGVIAIVSNVLCKPSSKYLSLEIYMFIPYLKSMDAYFSGLLFLISLIHRFQIPVVSHFYRNSYFMSVLCENTEGLYWIWLYWQVTCFCLRDTLASFKCSCPISSWSKA